MVRQRSLVISGLAWLGLASAAVAAETSPKAPELPIERRPYAIRVWVAADPSARLDARMREGLVSGWRTLVQRFVGAAWRLEVAEGDGPLASAMIDDLTAEQVAPSAKDADKVWLIQVGPAGSGLALAGREYDAATTLLGPTRRREAPYPADSARALLHLSLDVFSPSAEIAQASSSEATIRVQAGALPAADPIGRLVAEGTVFRPIRIIFLPDGSVKKDLIRSTYLRARSIEGPSANCQIFSSYDNPLSSKFVQKNRIVAVGMKPARVESRLRFVVAGPERRPAAGYTLTARTVPNGAPRTVGSTDREGRIALPADLADGLIILRLLAADVEPLAEFPLMPGELTEEKTYVLRDTMAEAVAFEIKVKALGDEVIDQVARRSRLEGLLKFRADAEVWDDVRTLLDEYKKLPTRDAFEKRLKDLEDDARRRQTRKVPILTKTAQAVLAETRGLVGYLDDEVFKGYEESLAEAKAKAGQGQGQKPAPGAAKSAAKAPGPYGRPAPPERDEVPLQGTWQAVVQGVDGREQPLEGDASTRPSLTLQEGSFAFDDRKGQVFRGSYRIDPSRSPKTIDFLFNGQAKHSFGIYELAGDRLTVCSAPPGEPRPTIFETRANTGLTLFKYERTDAPKAAAPSPPPEPAKQARPEPRKPASPADVRPL